MTGCCLRSAIATGAISNILTNSGVDSIKSLLIHRGQDWEDQDFFFLVSKTLKCLVTLPLSHAKACIRCFVITCVSEISGSVSKAGNMSLSAAVVRHFV